jgi:hypothetical protein
MALPAVALGLFAKGKDAVIEKGTTYEVVTDEPYTVERSAPAPRPSSSVAAAPARIPEAAGSATRYPYKPELPAPTSKWTGIL